MKKHIIIIGKHPLSDYVGRKSLENGSNVTILGEWSEDVDINNYDEAYVMMDDGKDSADAKAIDVIAKMANKRTDNFPVLTCHLLIHSNDTLQLLMREDWKHEIRSRMDVYPFSTDQMWASSIRVDWKPVTIQDDFVPHVVILGDSQMAEMVAIHVAQIAHFPNYIRNHDLRTRITIVDEGAEDIMRRWTTRFKHLFDNSYYRFVDAQQGAKVISFHEPVYASSREDFVDVEWEFVKASVYDNALNNKLQLWATDSGRQLLTVVMAYEGQTRNVNDAMKLPEALFRLQIPIYVYVRDDSSYQPLEKKGKMGNLRFFGMTDKGYDIRMPIVSMAKNVNYIYDYCYNMNVDSHGNEDGDHRILSPPQIDKQTRELLWRKLPNVKRLSNIYNAATITVKMRSVGIDENEWKQFYDLPQSVINIMAEVEHNRWNVEELLLGWRPCDDSEQMEVERNIDMKEKLKKLKIHYDIRAYKDLRTDTTGQNVNVYDLCLCAAMPMIAKTFDEDMN